MSLLTLAIYIIVIGVLMYLVNTYIPMQPTIKNILNIVVIIAVVLWIITVFFGAHFPFPDIHIRN